MNPSHPINRRLAPQTASTDEQRLRLVQSAYQLIVEKGMAGLRIREVASRIGLNHATLLYYSMNCCSMHDAIPPPIASSQKPLWPGSTPWKASFRKKYPLEVFGQTLM